MFQQSLRLLDAFLDQGRADGVAVVIVDAALFAQAVEYHHRFGVEPNRQWQRLDGSLVMTGLAFRCAIPMGEQARHCALHHAFVRRIETIFVTDGSHCSVIQICALQPPAGAQYRQAVR